MLDSCRKTGLTQANLLVVIVALTLVIRLHPDVHDSTPSMHWVIIISDYCNTIIEQYLLSGLHLIL